MKKIALITLVLSLVSIACERSEPLINTESSISSLSEKTYQGSISIADAKDWFTSTLLRLDAFGRVAAANAYERDIDWNSAKKVKQDTGLEIVVAPVKYKTNKRPGVIFWNSDTPENEKRPDINNVLDPKECLLVYKDKSGSVQSQLVQYIPSKEYKKKKKGRISDGDFTGLLFAMTWNEKFVVGFEFKDGKIVKALTPTTSTNAPGGRVASCDYNYYQTVVASCQSCGNNCTECNVIISGGYQGFCTGPSSDSGVDTNTGISYGSTPTSSLFTGSPYDASYAAPYTYSVSMTDDPPKFFVFKLRGQVTVTNPCQHAALKEYLSIIPGLESIYNNKVYLCLVENGYGGSALQTALGSLTISAIAKEMANQPWSTFLTVARGLLIGVGTNVLNANVCIKNIQGDTNIAIDTAYNKYIIDFAKPCN
jgi:hypothetical protein